MGETEADNLSRYIRVRKDDLSPATPRIFLEMDARRHLSLTRPYKVDFTLRRAKEDGSERPCIFRWSLATDAFSPAGFVLLRHTTTAPDGFEVVEVDHTGHVKLPEEDAMVIMHGQNADLRQLAPGSEVYSLRRVAKLPERYCRALKAGETYTLLYTGAEVGIWDWGTTEEHLGREMKTRHLLPPSEDRNLPTLMIPGGARITFTARAEETAWPGRAAYESTNGFGMANAAEEQWREEQARKSMRIIEGWPFPLGREDRVPGAPILNITLECPPTITLKSVLDIKVKVTYTGEICAPDSSHPASKTTARPITFRWWAILAGLDNPWNEGFSLYRRHSGGSEVPWEGCGLDDGCTPGFQIYDLPDEAVRVAEHDHFTTLRPGESWTTTQRLQAELWTLLPDDTRVGDSFLYGFDGAVMDWWDWGAGEEHADTVVMLPCWTAGRVTDPRDNEGRPKLVVAHSEGVEFRVTE